MRPATESMRSVATVVALLLLLAIVPVAHAEDAAEPATRSPNIAEKAVDLILIRPISLVRAMLGGFSLTVAYPLSLLSGDSDDILHMALLDPLDYALERPLGEW